MNSFCKGQGSPLLEEERSWRPLGRNSPRDKCHRKLQGEPVDPTADTVLLKVRGQL